MLLYRLHQPMIVHTLMSLVPGGVETRYSCCEGVMGAPGCQVFKVRKGGLGDYSKT